MKHKSLILLSVMLIAMFSACGPKKNNTENDDQKDTFDYLIDKFADIKIMQYQVTGWETLTLKQKKLVYYLSQAALSGRDIIWDQNYKHNLTIRRTLECILENYTGKKDSEEWEQFEIYVKRIWFSNGIHHHYSTDKILPGFTKDFFAELIKNTPDSQLPLLNDETPEELAARLIPIMFDPEIDAKRVNTVQGQDLLTTSSNNFYEGVTEKEAVAFYEKMKIKGDTTPISYGLNSKLIKENGKIVEKIWKVGGMYSDAIKQIVYWLDLAAGVAENQLQEQSIRTLIEYYKTGNLKTFDEYNIMWVKDTASHIDFVNGFTEVYGDPLAMRGSWEALVNFKDIEGTKRAALISQNAQWFEDNSPVDPKFKKKTIKGVTAKVITAAQLAGDCYPSTPIGINLPNANWIRRNHGSKSVTIDNITYSYDQASKNSGLLEEFAFSKEEIDLAKNFGYLASKLHTDLHECVGHGSGQLNKGVTGESLKNYHSPIEEARADLFALYFIMDKKLIELNLMPSLETGKATYINYIRNGLMTQLTRIDLGKNIEQAHMRCRQLIAKWAYEKGKNEKVIEKKIKNNKTYFVINDYDKLRNIFGEMLVEIQRITSEGDYEKAKYLVENYAVKIDPELHKEVKDRYDKLNLAPYGGFINPIFTTVMKDNKIVDITISYPGNYTEQMMYYSKKYSFLPSYN